MKLCRNFSNVKNGKHYTARRRPASYDPCRKFDDLLFERVCFLVSLRALYFLYFSRFRYELYIEGKTHLVECTWGDVHGERENFARNEEKRRRLEASGERRKPWRLKSSASVESTSTTRGLRGRTSASRSCRGVPRYASLSVVLPEVADGARERGGRDRDNCAVILRLQRCQFRRLNY